MITDTARITGVRLTDGRFRVHESWQSVDRAAVFDVLDGNLAAYWVHGFVPETDCRQIVANFWASTRRLPRYGSGEGGIEGYLVGASHIEKTTREYLREAAEFTDAVERLYEGVVDPVSAFRASLSRGGAVRVRPAELGGLMAGHSKAACWNDTGRFLLRPHDDLAQVRDPRQRDFEIQRATQVTALNIYPNVPACTGHLKLWNISPDERSRAELDVSFSGFPYPAELLEEYQALVIPVATGDACVLNGNLVHAVLQGNPTSPGKSRLLLTCFMTRLNRGEVIWWT
jgi:hypothetical protein